ncbi:MAG: DegT/DnrJ/EryC1/StrS family aminotransferase [Proteobacteria bacterium]|nr:DegT/DnrJ/EryC1/StrS family aminotransferase [Verrucomicrobiota bacterium]NBU09723.1 DegT/DnrJ/EryC1/StrS family aminotransferase [Pseudomonadota bacterium]
MERIPVSGPWITAREIAYVTDAVTNAWYGNANVWHERFEKSFAEHVGVKHAIALPHCTAAIHLSLLALNVGSGDEVIVPDCTWIASAAPITYVGATTVFADIDPRTWCLDARSFEACITPRTKAVIPVNLYGNMPDMDALREVARRHGIAIIEDAAESIGSEYKGQRAGSFGATGVFSFHGSKTLTTGEGGMLVTNRDDLRARVLFLRDHGRPPGDRLFHNTEVAYKYKMSSMQAALGTAQLERVEELVTRKREIFAWYAEELADLPGVTLNHEAPGTKNSYWMVTAILAESIGLRKERLMELLDAEGIDCRPFFHPLSSLPAYSGSPQAAVARSRNSVSYAISPFGINLPSALNLTREQVRRVAVALRAVLAAARPA